MSLLNLKTKKEPKYFKKSPQKIIEETFIEDTHTEIQSNINTASSLMIGEGVTITGTIKADNEVTIQGTIDGDVDCHTLIVSKTGNIKGNVKTEIMHVEGIVEGEININDLLHIKSDGSVTGKVFYGNIQIKEGGKLIGEINFRDKNYKQEEFKDWKSL